MSLEDHGPKGNVQLPFTGTTFNEMDVYEKYRSPTERYAMKQGGAYRTFRVKQYDARWDLAAYMLGWSSAKYAADGEFLGISRVLPEVYKPTITQVPVRRARYPVTTDAGLEIFPSPVEEMENEKPWLWASSIEGITGCGSMSTTMLPNLPPGVGTFTTYSEAEVQVGYEVKHYRLLEDSEMLTTDHTRRASDGSLHPDEMHAARYCSFHPQPSNLMMEVPRGGMVWDPASAPAPLAGKPSHGSTFFVKRSVDVQLRWYGVPSLPVGLSDHIATVNDRSWEIRPPGQHRIFAPHTLMYLGYKLHSYRQVTGSWAHDISLLFSYFEPGHNKELAFSATAEPRYAPLVGLGFDATSPDHLKQLLYSESNFAELFRLPDLS